MDPKKILPVVATFSLYGFQDGNPLEREIKVPPEIARSNKLLCQMNPKEALCKKPTK
jgi:hypothetical protein